MSTVSLRVRMAFGERHAVVRRVDFLLEKWSRFSLVVIRGRRPWLQEVVDTRTATHKKRRPLREDGGAVENAPAATWMGKGQQASKG